MSLLDRLFGSNRSRAYDEGLALLEKGRSAEAVDVLRQAVDASRASRADSLGGNLLRRALLTEGRRLLRAGQPVAAVPYFAEAAEIWADYPDLQWWHGAALGLSGRWSEALGAAHNALRRNPDYPEARLLEAAALADAGRREEAARSLMALRESGRRQDHWLTRAWDDIENFTPDNLPTDLPEMIRKVIQGESEKEQLAAAVALCRAGNWEQGTAAFRELVERRPRYPDYRTRLAAALFQTGQLDEALDAVEAALALHEGYAAALDLKALILADQGRFREAWEFLEATEASRTGQNPGSLEALFGAYLAGVLDLLLGKPGAVPGRLERWSDLVHDFAWAELLMAAADHLRGRRQSCTLRLEALRRAWPADAEYAYLLVCIHLESGRLDEAAAILDRWPRDDDAPDERPLFLQARLALAQGRQPEIPSEPAVAAGEAGKDDRSVLPRVMNPEAWAMVRAEAAFLRGDDHVCWETCRDLAGRGLYCERLLDLMLQCAVAGSGDADWNPPGVLPASCLAGACALALQRGDAAGAGSLLEAMVLLHPEILAGVFLQPGFWLQSVRRWLS